MHESMWTTQRCGGMSEDIVREILTALQEKQISVLLG
jgi:hypothetical protein